MRYLILLIFLVGCSIDHKIKGADVSGEVQIGYNIEQIRELCELTHIPEDYKTEVLRLKDVAQCTLDNLPTLGIDIDQEILDELEDLLDDAEE